MKETISNLSKIRKNVLVKTLDNPIEIEIEVIGESESPNLIILNGTVSESDFNDAKELICEGGVIAFTKGNSPVCHDPIQAQELYGDAYKIIASCATKGEYLGLIKNVLIYVKGLSIDKVVGANPWAISKKKGVVESLLFHNLGAKLQGFTFEEEVIEEIKEEAIVVETETVDETKTKDNKETEVEEVSKTDVVVEDIEKTEEVTKEEVVETVEVEKTEEAETVVNEEKTPRKRRTKAEIAEDEKKAAEVSKD